VAVSPDVSTRALGAADGFFYFEQTKSVGSFPDGVLWRTDGTEAGTAAVADVGAPGLGVAGDRSYFAGTDPQHGAELWSLPRPAGAFVRGSAWSPAFKSAFDATGLGDAAYGYRVDDKGAGDALPWINVNELVVRLPATPAAPGAPGPATVTFQSQRGVNYAVTRVDPVAGDPRAFVFVLDKPLGGSGADGSSDGDRLTVTVRGAGGDGADLTLRLNVLQGDTDRSGAVAADDAAAVKRKFFTSTEVPGPAGDSRYSVFHDVDGSGSILANDFSEVKKRFFHTLPPAPAAPAAAAAVRGRRRPLTRDIFGTTAVLG
jgi:hypothetical protein